jgi:putative transposase
VDSKDSLLGANQIQDFFREAVLGVMERLVLSDAARERMAPLIIGRPDQKGSTGRDNRMFVEGVLWPVLRRPVELSGLTSNANGRTKYSARQPQRSAEQQRA